MNKYHEEFRIEDGILHVGLSGEFPAERLHESANLFKPLAEACAANACSRALIDARAVSINLRTLDLYRAGEDIANLTRLGLRVALIAREDMLDPFFEDVAVNRGGRVAVFTDPEEAAAWVKES